MLPDPIVDRASSALWTSAAEALKGRDAVVCPSKERVKVPELALEMSDELLAYSIAKMKEYGIVDSGDSLKLGIGAMTDARMKGFFDQMVAAGVVKSGVDYKKAYNLQFVNKGVGLDLRPKN